MASLAEHRTYLSDVLARQAARRHRVDPGHKYVPQPKLGHDVSPLSLATDSSAEAGPSETAKGRAVSSSGASKDNVVNYIQAEEAVRNDYASWYGVSGRFPSNFVLGAGDDQICEEFPALRRLMDLKAEHVAATAHPPLYVPLDTSSSAGVSAALSPHRFDVILIHPPRNWAEAARLPIRQLSADPGFVFLWVGASDAGGLERGRECLAKWGFRRAEDIVWVKTNKHGARSNGGGLFASQKEHCLMGIRGTVRRSTDSRFVHCNVDTDVIVWEGEEGGPRTPPYLYTLIENFCLGARRLELFGDGSRARRGWVTVTTSTPQLSASEGDAATEPQLFDGLTYPTLLPIKEEGKPVLPFHPEIDLLRPKSPQRRGRAGRLASGPGGTATPPPSSHTPPFRPAGGVMRMGALTPAQGYHMNPGYQQGMSGMPAMSMGMGQPGMGGMGMAGMGPGGMLPMNMPQGMPAMQMAHMQGMSGMPGMAGVMPMQFQGIPGMVPGMMMGMGGMGGMPGMGSGMSMGMPMPMGGIGGVPMGMGMGGVPMGGMGMGGGMMGMGGMPMDAAGPSGSASPQEQPEGDEWAHHAHTPGHSHGHAMGQLAMGMGAMGMPYLGGGFQYNG